MSAGWLFIGLAVVLVVGGALPLIKDRGAARTPLPPRKETLKDWRNETLDDWRNDK
jgi:hypothetical protein